jgi:hypothetical protein
MDIQELVREVFFTKDTLAEFHYPEYHTGDSRMGWIPRTQKYNAIFPHDLIETPETFEEIVQKYVRRFERLQSLILDNTNNLNFVYISQSSLERGNFVVDNVPVIVDVYNNLNKLYDIIKSIRSDNFKFIMIDSINSEDSVHLNKNIIRHIIQPKSEWLHIVDDCMEVLKVYV